MRKLFFKVLEGGRLPDGVKQALLTILPPLAGKEVYLEIAEKKDTASDKQRRYYFKFIVGGFQKYYAEQGINYDKDNLHDAMMKSIGGFNNPFVNPFNGEPDEGRKSYNELTKAQAEGYHTLCRKLAAEKGVDIPEPNEVPMEDLCTQAH